MDIESEWKKGKKLPTDWDILQDIPDPVAFLRESMASSRDKEKISRLIGRLEDDSGRISEGDLQSARDYPIYHLVPKFRQSGSKKLCNCPFHGERTASMVIYEDNSFHCFGCQAHGKNAVDFITLRDNCSFREAVNHLLTI